jgi:hypothetical protein
VAYSVLMTQGQPPVWVGLTAAVPLICLLITGAYLFALPYVSRRRGAQA